MEERPLSEEERETLRKAVEAFNRGDYHAAHDLFESLWGEEVFKGLVQASVALHHWSVGNLKGIEGLPESIDRILAKAGPRRHGLNIAAFRNDVAAFLARHRPSGPMERNDVPRLRWAQSTSSPRKVARRGST